MSGREEGGWVRDLSVLLPSPLVLAARGLGPMGHRPPRNYPAVRSAGGFAKCPRALQPLALGLHVESQRTGDVDVLALILHVLELGIAGH